MRNWISGSVINNVDVSDGWMFPRSAFDVPAAVYKHCPRPGTWERVN